MTALAGAFGPRAGDRSSDVVALLDRMPTRGSGQHEIWGDLHAVIAARRHPWEAELDGWSGPLVIETGSFVIAADATLYYIADLRRRLAAAGTLPSASDTAQLILASLNTWGDKFAEHLEGDFAILVYDKQRGRMLLARDFGGKRLLTFAVGRDGDVVVASSPTAVAEFPGVSARYDLDVIAAAAAGGMQFSERTAFADVRPVAAGVTVCVAPNEPVRVVQQWLPPSFSDEGDGTPAEDAAEELRKLLRDATRERMPSSGNSVLWMSGGWDSTSVFASGQVALQFRADSQLLPVTVRFPPGDRGYETEFVNAVAGRWQARITYVTADEISILPGITERAGRRDDPLAHPYEAWQRRLAKVSRSLGVRIVLDGYGGDQLFVASDAILAEHLKRGRFDELLKAWRQKRKYGYDFVRTCILPLLGTEVREWIGTVRGRPLPGYWDLTFPNWITRRESVAGHVGPAVEMRPDESVSAYESRFMLENPFMPRANTWNHTFALDEGIQLRSPLYDPRVIEFASRRPVMERTCDGESKLLLRRAMRGLLPDSVLAARKRKTGIPSEYFGRQMRAFLANEISNVFGDARRSPVLADLGLVDVAQVLQAAVRFAEVPEHLLGSWLYATYEAELWLAARATRT